ncbi:hypothetical protein BJ508DRAFT_314072 [Ascobolus immersus RN42]|uniref:Uncharacterized protein n=1 Tax=Ascobolus immersus RN42 TaxID=1160509 RepID=A0A3N4HMT7_ASCIM|nr:hypothetical protein BJ508DRAFT_314072 [Ascobolus immersus RN42]
MLIRLFQSERWTTDPANLLLPFFEDESGIDIEKLNIIGFLEPEEEDNEKSEEEPEADVLLRVGESYLMLVSSWSCCFLLGKVGEERDVMKTLLRYTEHGELAMDRWKAFQKVQVNALWEFKLQRDGDRSTSEGGVESSS